MIMKKVHFLTLTAILILFSCSSNDDSSSPSDTLLDGIVGKFDLDGNGNDSSGFENNCTIIQLVTPTTNRSNQDNTAMHFGGTTLVDYGYLSTGNAESLNATTQMSISVWANLDNFSPSLEWKTIVNKWNGTAAPTSNGTEGYYLGLRPTNNSTLDHFLRWNFFNHIIESNVPFPLDQWVHVVTIYDGQSIKLYVNGTLEAQMDGVDVDISNNSVPFRIGMQSNILDSNFNGKIDDLYIYDRVLTENEILSLSN